MSIDDGAICDALLLAMKVAELAELRGGSVADVRRELEKVWIQCAYAQDLEEVTSMSIRDLLPGRSPVSGEVELVAVLENARDGLAQVQRAAEIEIAAARGNVTVAQGRLDEFRRDLVARHAQIWRQRAEDLRRQAEGCGDETTTVAVAVWGSLDGARVEPRLEYLRNVLSDQAVAADGTASHLEGRLSAGDEVNSGESLALLVSELLPLPESAELVTQVV